MRKYRFTKAEMETLVNYDEELPTATIYTFDQRMINKLKKLSEKYPEQFILKAAGPNRAVTYELPKRCLCIRPPYNEKRRAQQKKEAEVNGSPFAGLEGNDGKN